MQFFPIPLSGGSLSELQATVDQNLRLLSEVLAGPAAAVRLQVLTVPPTKPRDGWLVRADGVSWNPGAGAGVYEYRAGAWVKL